VLIVEHLPLNNKLSKKENEEAEETEEESHSCQLLGRIS
jgi:hypothetical protein